MNVESDNALNLVRLLQQQGHIGRSTSESQQIPTARFCYMAQRMLQQMEAGFSKRLAKNVYFSLKRSSNRSEREELSSAHGVTVNLRMFGQPIQLFLPAELVQELGASVLRKPTSRLLFTPSDEDLTATSFLIAQTLAEDELFVHQRIYLTDIRRQGAECSAALSNCNADLSPLPLTVDIVIEGQKFSITVALSSNLIKRFTTYAKHFYLPVLNRPVLNKLKIKWQIRLRFQLPSLEFLAHLGTERMFTVPLRLFVSRPGQRRKLNHMQLELIRCESMPNENGTSLILEKPGKTKFSAEVLEGSAPGLFRLKLSNVG